MRKFLSIVIPRFQEAERDIFPLLASISGQVGVDFSDIETVISNDGGSTPLDENFLGLFDMEIRQVFLENNGGYTNSALPGPAAPPARTWREYPPPSFRPPASQPRESRRYEGCRPRRRT